MSVDRPESYLTNLDIQMRVNDDEVSVTYGGSSANREADQDFVRRVAYESGAATAEIVNTSRSSVVVDPELLQERRGMTLGEEVHFTIPAPVENDPLVIAAKEITKPAADIAPVLSGKEPAQRGFDLPPQHIIDAKTITVTETPIGPDGVPLGPVKRSMVEVSPGILLPTLDVVRQNQGNFFDLFNNKSYSVSPEMISIECVQVMNQAEELFPLLTSAYVQSFDSELPESERVNKRALTEYYLGRLGEQTGFLDELCRPYLTDEQNNALDVIHNNVITIRELMGMEPNATVLDQLRDFVLRIQERIDDSFGGNGPMMPPLPPLDIPDLRWLFRQRH